MNLNIEKGTKKYLPVIKEPDLTEILDVINRFASRLPTFGSNDALYWYVAEEIIPALGFEDCVIYQYNSKSQKLIQKSAWNHQQETNRATLTGLELSIGEGVTGTAAQSGKIEYVADTRTDSRYVKDSLNYLSECSVPMLYNGKVIGVLDSEHSQVGFYTEQKQQLLVTVAALLSTRVGNSISLDKVKLSIEKLRDSKKIQKALFEIASVLQKSHNLDDFYRRLHKIIDQLMYAGNFYIALYDKKKQAMQLPYFVDTLDEAPDKDIPIEHLKTSLTYYCIIQNKTFFLTSEAIDEMDREHGFVRYGTTPNAWLGVPFILDKNTSGIIVVQSYLDTINYTEKDSELLEFVAQHLSTTLKYKRAQDQIHHQALHDNLTGLANRSLFTDRLQHRMAGRKRTAKGMFAILFLDLDHFKEINDSLGHLNGDLVLQEVSDRLRNSVRINDTIARFGGDEFAILLDTIEAQSEAIDAANRIIGDIEKEFIIDNENYHISVSIGIRCCTDETDITEVIKNADLAMYQAKQLGRARYSIYLKDQVIIEATRKKLKQALRTAIETKQFILYYQPVVLLDDLSITSFEALIRWQHPSKGLLEPEEFIDVAEQSGLITEIDILAMDLALSQLKNLIASNPETDLLTVNVNLSAKHFASTDIISIIRELLFKHNISGKHLKIEVTETALIESLEIMSDLIKQIRDLDVSILLDDFGTGYSSLSYLHQFPIDTLKIDRTFISNMPTDTEHHHIIKTILALADAMDMDVVAEGIEKDYQLIKLAEMGCQYGQGSLFSKPLAFEGINKLLAEGIILEEPSK